MTNPLNLTGKKILLFGESSGIDEAIASQLNELGASVVPFEQKDINLVESDLKQLAKDKGTFDGFVFTLMHSDFRPLQFVKPELVAEILNDNYLLFVEGMRVLRKSKALKNGASVVALSSISSIRAMKAKMAFCSAKAALDAAVRCLAIELADKSIRINSIQKGVVDADFAKGHIKDVVSINDGAAEKAAPLGVTKAEEVANTVAFLLSDATRTITGTSIVIDGGYTL
jgi:enoyl-[acyl-carrier-protein] reductase (NADH)